MMIQGQALNGLDWVLVMIGAYCLIRGMWRGAISQVVGIFGIVAAFYVSYHYCEPLAGRLDRSFPDLPKAELISLILLFMLTWFVVSMMGYWFSRLAHKGGMGFADRLLGGLVGLGKAIIAAAVLISCLLFFFSPRDSFIGQSLFAPYVQEITNVLIKATPPSIQKQFAEKRGVFLRYWTEKKEGHGIDRGDNR